MRLYLSAKTAIPDLYIDYIEVILTTGEQVSLNWDYSDICREDDGFCARYKGVYFGEEYANGRLAELKKITIVEVGGKKYKLVHASPIENFSSYWKRYYDDEREFAVWERWDECHPIPEGFTLIFGHTPTCYFQETEPIKIWRSDEAIGIDCACGYFDGRLACLRLDDMKEFYSTEAQTL